MTDFLNIRNDFLEKVIATIEENLADESYGVSELANDVGMSRSNLLRKVQKLTGLSVSVLMRQVRLHNARQLLRADNLTVSEVSYQVGFNSVSYFVKCYRELYSYPPGEEVERSKKQLQKEIRQSRTNPRKPWLLAGIVALVLLAVFVFYPNKNQDSAQPLEKSIAVLPFKNDSRDSSNVHIINGLMEAILNNLQKIEDLRVVSRTSVEKYRGGVHDIAQISEDLDVNYILEGSGQKVGDNILLTVQLIAAPRDKHLWSDQYSRVSTDIFALQAEVAKDIAQEIEVIITPEEIQNIEKVLTENPLAYDLYLQGMDQVNKDNNEKAIDYFKAAIEEDPEFAEAYAQVAMSYFNLDIFLAEKQYGAEINTYADRALVIDGELASSLIAKGLYYMHNEEYELAVEFLEKTLIYNPNSSSAHNLLSFIYNTYVLDTKKYLRYALRAVELDKSVLDSTTNSYTYLNLSNALAQHGFMEEAAKYARLSLAYDSTNLYSQYLYVYINLSGDLDLNAAYEQLKQVLAQDTTRLDIIQEIGKVLYTMEDYESANYFYQVFTDTKEQYGLDIFPGEDIKIAFVLDKVGEKEKSQEFLNRFKQYTDADNSIYKDLNYSAYYAMLGEVDKAMEYLKRFSEQRDYFYWLLLWMEKDPILSKMSSHPDYQSTIEKLKSQFWEEHDKTRKFLQQEGLL